jgi:DNA helicase II / ATP-dependent DNA helicase PcrA
MKLTAEQHEIITADAGHCVITAVAGSGKTTTLAWRIRHLLQQNYDPRRILILMFNRAAKEDFDRKLQAVCKDLRLRLPEVRTFHAMGYRLYQRFVQEGYLPPFKRNILSEQEVQYQLWMMIRQLTPPDLQDDIQRDKKDHIEIAGNFIDLVKSSVADPQQLFEHLGYSSRHNYLIDLFDRFEDWRKQEQRISYADMLYEPVLAIEHHAELQALVSNKMDVILVDEYQDTNEVQHLLLKHIAGDRAKVTVVGDPDQTIYEFRGARPEYLLTRFREEFPASRDQTLTFSFRYGHRVALLANHLITHNKDRNSDVLCKAHPGNPATGIHLLETQNEPESILSIVRQYQADSIALSTITVLVRVWSQAVNIELALLAADIPYRIDDNKGALFTREVDTLLDLLAYADDRFQGLPIAQRTIAFQRILRFPHVGLKEQVLHEVAGWLGHLDNDWSGHIHDELPEKLGPLQKRKLRQAARSLERLRSLQGDAGKAIGTYIEDSELFKTLRELALTHDIAEDRIDRVCGLVEYLKSLKMNCGQALDHLLGLRQRAGRQQHREGLLLTTIHRSKGLEWPIVIIPGLSDRYLPYLLKPPEDLPAQLQSERRLLYVAMTRTQQCLHLLMPPEPSQPTDTAPSSFIAELCFEHSERLGSELHDKPAAEVQHEAPAISLTPVSKRYLLALMP